MGVLSEELDVSSNLTTTPGQKGDICKIALALYSYLLALLSAKVCFSLENNSSSSYRNDTV